MGDIIGKFTDAIGLTDRAGEKRAAVQAGQLAEQGFAMSKEQIALAKEELAFQKEQYGDWKNIYGELQENLGAYYKDLDPDRIAVLGLEKQQFEFQQLEKEIKRDFAQRGLKDSGEEIAISSFNKFQNATARASIRATAEDVAAEKKMSFLGLGLGQGTQMLSTIAGSAQAQQQAFSTAVGSRTNLANSYLNRSTQLGVAGIQQVGKVVGTATSSYLS